MLLNSKRGKQCLLFFCYLEKYALGFPSREGLVVFLLKIQINSKDQNPTIFKSVICAYADL